MVLLLKPRAGGAGDGDSCARVVLVDPPLALRDAPPPLAGGARCAGATAGCVDPAAVAPMPEGAHRSRALPGAAAAPPLAASASRGLAGVLVGDAAAGGRRVLLLDLEEDECED